MNVGIPVSEPADPIPEITSIIHELRNPLSALHGGAEMLISSTLSGSQIFRVARNMYGATVRMRELLDEFFSRYGRMAGRESFDLRNVIAKAVDKIALIADSQSVRVIQNLPENLVINADGPGIQRVFVNLLVNALEVLPEGGTIRISAIASDESVVIRVRDSGPGIPPEIRDRLFQPFATAGKTNGLGLGLAWSRQTVVDHGGRIWAERARQGACFAIRLPMTTARTCAASC
jgi:signal transduction histidine kinase